jgi:hypothetical protein
LRGGKLNSKKLVYIQKRLIRKIAGAKRRASCTELFKKFDILPLATKFFLSLLPFVMNMENFQTNSDIHSKYKTQI